MDAEPRTVIKENSPRTGLSPTSGEGFGLRVALVHDWLTGRRGGEKCLEVLCRLFPRAVVHTLIHVPGASGPTIERMPIRTSMLQQVPGIHRHYRHFLPLMPMAARGWEVGDVDLVFSLSHCVAKAVRVPAGVPHVCYCFTPMRYAWESRDAYFESWSKRPVRRKVAGLVLDRLRAWDRATAQGVSHFIAISETVKGRIERCYGRESQVIQPPVDSRYYTPDPEARGREDYYLCVSALVGYKRVEHAVEACGRSGRRLVVVGEGPEGERLRRMGVPGVEFVGWQPDEVIRAHYRRCKALLFPGEEDFGIVPIEALACGAPVIALGRGGVAETVNQRVGRLYDEPGADGLLRAIEDWEAAGAEHDAAAARQAAEQLDLTHFEARIARFVHEVAAAKRVEPVPPRPHLTVPPDRRGLGGRSRSWSGRAGWSGNRVSH